MRMLDLLAGANDTVFALRRSGRYRLDGHDHNVALSLHRNSFSYGCAREGLQFCLKTDLANAVTHVPPDTYLVEIRQRDDFNTTTPAHEGLADAGFSFGDAPGVGLVPLRVAKSDHDRPALGEDALNQSAVAVV